MPASWKHSSSRRGSTTTDTGGSDGVSAIYAAASGLHPPPSERTKTDPAVQRVNHTTSSNLATVTPCLSSWLPQRLGKFDRPIVLRDSDSLPELLEGVFERNRALALSSSRASGNQR